MGVRTGILTQKTLTQRVWAPKRCQNTLVKVFVNFKIFWKFLCFSIFVEVSLDYIRTFLLESIRDFFKSQKSFSSFIINFLFDLRVETFQNCQILPLNLFINHKWVHRGNTQTKAHWLGCSYRKQRLFDYENIAIFFYLFSTVSRLR